MSIERVRQYLREVGGDELCGRVREFDVSSATVELAAAALGCEPCRIAKSLALSLSGSPILVVAAGDVKIDNAKYKSHFGAKAKMLTPEETLTLIGHAVGGVCPFALSDGVTVYLDRSLYRFETVFPACGSSSSAIELTIAELELYSGFEGTVDVCKLKEQ